MVQRGSVVGSRSHSWSMAETRPEPRSPGSLPRAPSMRPHRWPGAAGGRAVPSADGWGRVFGIGRDAQLHPQALITA